MITTISIRLICVTSCMFRWWHYCTAGERDW